MAAGRTPKISLGFVVRRCTLELGHPPSAREFSAWANTAGEYGAALFGRRITAKDAEVILRNLAREVTANRVQPHESDGGDEGADGTDASEPTGDSSADNVIDFAAARERRDRRRG